MSKNEKLNAFLDYRNILVAVCILLAWLVGWAIVQGKVKILFLLYVIPTAFFIVLSLSERVRFWLLIAAILLAPLQMPGLPNPYGISLSELLLLALAAVQLVRDRQSERLSPNLLSSVGRFLPYIAFASASLVSALRSGEIGSWIRVSLVPLLLIILMRGMIHKPEDALRLVQAALVSILGYLSVIGIASKIGSVINNYGTRMQWRLGSMDVTLGPIQFTSWAIGLGALLALGVPFVTAQLFRSRKTTVSRLAYAATLVLMVTLLAWTSARAATIGAAIGVILVLVVSRRCFSLRLIVALLLLTLSLSIWGPRLVDRVPELGASLERWRNTNWTSLGNEGNFRDRFDLLQVSLESIEQNPFGFGYSYFSRIGLPDDNGYALLLNGTGLMGFLSFVFIVGCLASRLIAFAVRGGFQLQGDLVAVGLGTLVCGLLVGYVCSVTFDGPVHSLVFWVIIIAADSVTRVGYDSLYVSQS